MDEPSQRALRLFVQKANSLRQSGFRATIQQLGTVRTEIRWNVETGFSQSTQGPDSDEIAAFILTLRFFIQNNEPTSINNMAALLGKLNPSASIDSFLRSRDNFNAFLDTPIQAVIDGEHPTRRDVLWTVVYGQLAHSNPTHEATLNRWNANPVAAAFIQAEFLATLMACLSAIDALARKVEEVINESGLPTS